MMFKDIQTLENAARTAMAGNDDPLPVQQRLLKPSHYGLAFITLLGAAYLLLA
ncbi:hypothetical protein J3U99_16655 [Brucella pituitosa]|uniref:Uncharacterized protein n=2 Tax=Brucella TaxID=234 RepID=A0A256FE20_9HYPH|nr:MULTISPECIES: hypothetical protein [Brucella]TCQ79172.1 hypothetical protein EDF68_105197 [Ochrobactrum sp. BH3]MBO1041804.1 hypothetical protein [Brucella pituitosa]MCK4206410.1 hypothetical protein [Brucella pituitosa]NKB83424.1 hypothetical protein [Brucella grignonensis]OYR13109.1 hypothetical protein CEV33_0832 [Brucella grignonensis]